MNTLHNTIYKYIFILVLAASSQLEAQIESSSAKATGISQYSNDVPLFIYSDINAAELKAKVPDGNNITYTWERLDAGIWSEVMTSNDPSFINVSEGAYRLSVNDGDTLKQYTCWTFVPEILSLDVDTVSSDCFEIKFTTKTTTKPLSYSNPATGNLYNLDYKLDYDWQSEPSIDLIEKKDEQATFKASSEPAVFTVSANAFNGAHILSSSFDFKEPIAVKANFTFNVTDKGNINEIPQISNYKNLTSYTGSSEILVFINDSSKGSNKSYTISFEVISDGGGSKPTESELMEITFDKLGTYIMTVTVRNDISGCSDFTKFGEIKIEKFYLEFPNVFTPNGDSKNDKFMAIYSSVKEFKLVVLNRWGRIVFQTTDLGDAWDGKIGGKDAAEGVYFYVATAKDYESGERKKREGTVHLFRGK